MLLDSMGHGLSFNRALFHERRKGTNVVRSAFHQTTMHNSSLRPIHVMPNLFFKNLVQSKQSLFELCDSENVLKLQLTTQYSVRYEPNRKIKLSIKQNVRMHRPFFFHCSERRPNKIVLDKNTFTSFLSNCSLVGSIKMLFIAI